MFSCVGANWSTTRKALSSQGLPRFISSESCFPSNCQTASAATEARRLASISVRSGSDSTARTRSRRSFSYFVQGPSFLISQTLYQAGQLLNRDAPPQSRSSKAKSNLQELSNQSNKPFAGSHRGSRSTLSERRLCKPATDAGLPKKRFHFRDATLTVKST